MINAEFPTAKNVKPLIQIIDNGIEISEKNQMPW